MIFQWLISIALTAEIIMVGMKGYVLLAQLHQAHSLVVQELTEVRFIVGYFKAVLHQGSQIAKNSDSQQILAVHNSEKTRRYYLTEGVNRRGFVLWVREGDQRSEVLSHEIKFLRLQYCINRDSKLECQSASGIQDWHAVRAVEFTLEFFENPAVDKVLKLKNQHRWHFLLKLG